MWLPQVSSEYSGLGRICMKNNAYKVLLEIQMFWIFCANVKPGCSHSVDGKAVQLCDCSPGMRLGVWAAARGKRGLRCPEPPEPSGHACALVLQNSPVIFLKVRCSWHLFWKCHVYMPWHIYFFAIQERDAFYLIHISIFFIQSGRSSNRQMFNFYMALVWNCLWLKISIGVRVSELMSVHFPSLFSNSVLAFNC